MSYQLPGTNISIPCNPLVIRFAVNTAGRDKDWDFKLLASQFKDKQGTIEDVKCHVKAGHALCAGLLNSKWRAKSNVLGSYWILLDIDNSDVLRDDAGQPVRGEDGKTTKIYKHDLTLDEALAHPFVQTHCALIYTTASHKPDWHKFRLVFLLPEFVEGADTVEACTRLLMQQFPHDRACKDASRVFYGSTSAEFPLVQPNATLPREWVQEARYKAEQERIEFARRLKEVEERRKQFQELSLLEGWDIDRLIQEALNYIPPRAPGSNNYQECFQVLVALVSHYGEAEAEVIAELWSPSIKGTTWNIRQKIRSFRRGGISIGTLFHIAKQYGFKFPKIDSYVKEDSYNEPDSKLYDEYLERENSDARSAESQEFQFLFNKASNKVKRFLSKAFKGFGKKHRSAPRIAPKAIKIRPGEVPTPEEYDILGKPRLEFKATDRFGIWAECVAKGWQHILDTSGTGSGKSHNAGSAQPKNLGVDQIWFLASDHRNPTTDTIEFGYRDLPARNNGFKIDKTRLTPSGKNFQVWTKPGEKPDLAGNCERTHLFQLMAEKNIEGMQESAVSPICETCRHFKSVEVSDGSGGTTYRPKCSVMSSDGYGFRGQYASTLSSDKIRAHPNSAPQPRIDFSQDKDGKYTGTGFDYRQVGLFWDEAGTLIEVQKVIEVRLEDLKQTLYHVFTKLQASCFEEINAALKPIWGVLTALLDTEALNYIKDTERFGLNDNDIRILLPEKPANLSRIILTLAHELAPDLGFLEEKGDRVDWKQKSHTNKRALASAQAALETANTRQKTEELKNLLLNWLVPFLKAWQDDSGYFKRDFGSVLKIYSRSNRHTNVASSTKWNIYLDATLTPQILASMLDNQNILHIKQEMPSYKNLRVIQVTGMGRLSSDRRESADRRVVAALTELSDRHPGLAVIDWKSKSTLGQGYHFRDGRGVNRFNNAPALAIVGTPCPNIGALAIKYQLLKNKPAVEHSPEFQAFVDEHIQSEIIQELGRLRANLRPKEQLSAYILSDYNLDFLKTELPDACFEQLDAFKLTPDAGDKLQRTKYGILKAFGKLVESGVEADIITQDAIANASQITRSRISQIASLFGGWSKLRKLLVLLYKSLLYNKTNNSQTPSQTEQELDSDLLWLAHEYLPLIAANSEDSPPDDVIREILHVIEAEGVQRFKSAIQLTHNGTKNGILGYLTAMFTTDLAEYSAVLGG